MTRALLLAGGASCLLAAAPPPHVFVDGTERAVQHWTEQHEAYKARAKLGGIDVLFLGDSLTYAWNFDGREVWAAEFAPLGAVAFGIGGDRCGDVLWRVEDGELESSGAKAVVLEIGTNDLGTGKGSEATAAAIAGCVRAIRKALPDATVLLCSVLPRGAGDATAPMHVRVAEVNARLAKLDDGKRVRFADVTAAFSNFDGTVRPALYHPDLLHLSAAGYRAWADALQPALARVLR